MAVLNRGVDNFGLHRGQTIGDGSAQAVETKAGRVDRRQNNKKAGSQADTASDRDGSTNGLKAVEGRIDREGVERSQGGKRTGRSQKAVEPAPRKTTACRSKNRLRRR